MTWYVSARDRARRDRLEAAYNRLIDFYFRTRNPAALSHSFYILELLSS